MLRRTLIRSLYHLLFWTGVAFLWFYLRYQDYPSLQHAAVVTVVKVADLAAAIYIANLLLVPRLLYRKRYGLFALAFLGLIAAASFSKMLLLNALLPDNNALELFPASKKKCTTTLLHSFSWCWPASG
jgi:two-component system LytT family sensor kinase